MAQGLKDPRQQSKLGRLADRDVNLAHAREWSRQRMMTARQLADEIENIKNSRRADVAGVSEWDGSPGRSKGDLLRERVEKGLIAAPAAGLASIGVGAVGPAMLAAPSSLAGKVALGTVSGALSGIGGEDPSFGALAGVVPAIGAAQLVNSMYRDEPLVPMSEAKAGDWRRLFSGLSTPNKLNRPFYATTDPSYASKRAVQKSKSDDPMFVHMPKVDDDRLIQFGKTYNTLSAPEAFRNFPRGDSVTGEDIYAALKPLADEHSDYLVKSMGYAGHERPNTGDFGNGQWFRIADPDAVTQKFAGGGSVLGGLKMLKRALTGEMALDVGTLGVIKNKGGNWLSGSVEGALSGLKKRMDPELEGYARNGQNLMPHEAADVLPKIALNSFIDKQLTRYVKNDMATPEDPIRALAERGVLHYDPANEISGGALSKAALNRGRTGNVSSGIGESQLAKQWEALSDAGLGVAPASEWKANASPEVLSRMPWLGKLSDEALIFEKQNPNLSGSLGFSHLTDELANALNPESGLPRHLLLDPKSMDRVSVPQAVERVAAINAWRAAQKAEADMLRANNAATVLYKDYPQGSFWHGGNYTPGEEITRPLYVSRNKDFAASYVDMAKDRTGKGSLSRMTQSASNPAPSELVIEEARKLDIDVGAGTPASIFDSELHGEGAVNALVRRLKAKGYDSAQMQDIGYGVTLEDTPTILFPGVKTNKGYDNPMGLRWVELKSPEPKTFEELTPKQQEWYHDYLNEGVSPEGALRNAAKRDPQALQDALKYEGDTMGHCVGGYCDDVASGRTKIYSLRDAKGQPHVTIEVQPYGLKYDRIDPEMGDRDLMVAMGENIPRAQGRRFQEWLENDYAGDNLAEEIVGTPWEKFLPPKVESPRIVQIKGKQNRAPNEEYLPFVQDFVKSGKWSDVGDLQNSGLISRSRLNEGDIETLNKLGKQIPDYLTTAEYQALVESIGNNFAHGGSVRQTKPFTVQDLQAIIAQINQEHLNAA